MSDQIRQFIDNVTSGQNAEAKENIENILSAKAFETLDTIKQNIASSIFGGERQSQEDETEIEVQETE